MTVTHKVAVSSQVPMKRRSFDHADPSELLIKMLEAIDKVHELCRTSVQPLAYHPRSSVKAPCPPAQPGLGLFGAGWGSTEGFHQPSAGVYRKSAQ